MNSEWQRKYLLLTVTNAQQAYVKVIIIKLIKIMSPQQSYLPVGLAMDQADHLLGGASGWYQLMDDLVAIFILLATEFDLHDMI